MSLTKKEINKKILDSLNPQKPQTPNLIAYLLSRQVKEGGVKRESTPPPEGNKYPFLGEGKKL
jgi:hypothetical protein